MARLIRAVDLMKRINRYPPYIRDVVRKELRYVPTGDAVEVVRCKDCKHRDPEDHKCDSGALERAGCVFPVGDDYFCAWGERKEDEVN